MVLLTGAAYEDDAHDPQANSGQVNGAPGHEASAQQRVQEEAAASRAQPASSSGRAVGVHAPLLLLCSKPAWGPCMSRFCVWVLIRAADRLPAFKHRPASQQQGSFSWNPILHYPQQQCSQLGCLSTAVSMGNDQRKPREAKPRVQVWPGCPPYLLHHQQQEVPRLCSHAHRHRQAVTTSDLGRRTRVRKPF